MDYARINQPIGLNALTPFIEYISNKRVAIVGNAPTVRTFATADIIDSSDVVIRFNRFDITTHPKKSGVKTDVLALPLHYPKAYPKSADSLQGVRWVLGCSPKTDEPLPANSAMLDKLSREDVSTDRIAYLDSLTGARPTTGLIAFDHVFRHAAKVYLTGFSFDRLPTDHYGEDQNRFNYGVHDPLKEMFTFCLLRHAYGETNFDRLVETDLHIRCRMKYHQPSDEFGHLLKRQGEAYSLPHRRMYDRASKLVKGRVVEIGAGIGYGVEQLLKNPDVTSIEAIEPDPRAFRYLLGLTAGLNDSRVSVRLNPFGKGPRTEFGVAIEVVEHVPTQDIPGFLATARRRFDTFIFSTPDRTKNKHGVRTPYEWTIAAKVAGFANVEVTEDKWDCLFVCS